MSVSLNSALSGLKAAQQALNTISTNIANASTPGYTRKILPQETLVVDGRAAGVSLQSLIRNIDKSLVRDVNKQASLSGSAAIEQKYLQRVQDFHGASEQERSISAQIGKLGDAFSALSSAPNNSLYLNDAVSAAQRTATKFNEFSALINQMRTDSEDEISSNVNQVNELLEKIARLNVDIGHATTASQTSADLEDQRDVAMKELSKYLQISSFLGEDNQIVVQTKQGQILADTSAHKLVFNKSHLGPSSYYPGGGANGVYIDSVATGFELTGPNLGGALGSLLKLRDDTLPTYQAQIDEMAQKLSARFAAEGLKLFTDGNGNVPATVAYPGVVGYVGYAGTIRVNPAVVADPTLLRSGTNGNTVLEGSNEVVNKISKYAFGAYSMQAATSTANISVGTIFTSTGMTQYNKIIGISNVSAYGDLDTAPNITAPASFSITANGGTYAYTINPGDTAITMINSINTSAGFNLMSLNGLGQIVMQADTDILVTDGGIGASGLVDLGFAPGTYVASDPALKIQVGSQTPVTVNISTTDTAATLLATLNAIPGLTASLDVSGRLVLSPTEGGDLSVENAVGTPLAALGMTVANVAHTAFRSTNLGPAGTLTTGILGNSTIEDFARSMISDQAEDHALAADTSEKESAFLETLSNRLSNQSGVDIDEELSNLIRVQTAYTAAARMISATEKTFDELLQAFQ